MLQSRVAIALGVASLLGCGDDDDDDDTGPPIFAEGEIGPEGGSLTSGDGVATFSLPAGAIDAPAGFFIDETTDPLPPGAIGRGYLIGPSTSFAEPGLVSLGVPPDAGIPDGADHAVRIATSHDGVAWTCISAVIASLADGAARAVTDQLSSWTLLVATCGSHADCALPEKCLAPDAHGNRYCGIPCIDGTNCPTPMFCDDSAHACRFQPCSDGAGCSGESTCSANEGHGVCDLGAAECTEQVEQFTPTAEGRCMLTTQCVIAEISDTETPCAELGLDFKYCHHGWCVDQSVGCACGAAGCPCTD